MLLLRQVMIATACLVAGAAVAAEPAFMPKVPTTVAQSKLPCQCRAMGQMFDLGAQICLDGTNGRQAFSCGLDQNVTSWQATGKACPES